MSQKSVYFALNVTMLSTKPGLFYTACLDYIFSAISVQKSGFLSNIG